MQTERWLPVPGYIGFYEVSSNGRVRSVTRTVDLIRPGYEPARILRRGALMRLSPARKGHLKVTLHKDGKRKVHLVHHLVLCAFVGDRRPEGLETLHGPKGPADNSLENIRWGTRKENSADRDRDGTMCRGTSNWAAKLSEADVLTIRQGVSSISAAARQYGVSRTSIRQVLQRKTWSHI